jgi:hypothetical protein
MVFKLRKVGFSSGGMAVSSGCGKESLGRKERLMLYDCCGYVSGNGFVAVVDASVACMVVF